MPPLGMIHRPPPLGGRQLIPGTEQGEGYSQIASNCGKAGMAAVVVREIETEHGSAVATLLKMLPWVDQGDLVVVCSDGLN